MSMKPVRRRAAARRETVPIHIVVTITLPESRCSRRLSGAGTHITPRFESLAVRIVGAGPPDVICVDTREVAVGSGYLIPARKDARSPAAGRLGNLAGVRPGRTSGDQITLFESQGMGIQDIAVAARVVERALERGLGTALPY